MLNVCKNVSSDRVGRKIRNLGSSVFKYFIEIVNSILYQISLNGNMEISYYRNIDEIR